MALTRKMLKAMGIEDEKIDQIIEAHAETTEALKAERDAAQQAAKENENAQKELEDLKANTEYTGYTAASSVVQWFWEAVKGFNKEDMARLLQFVTGTSKVI